MTDKAIFNAVGTILKEKLSEVNKRIDEITLLKGDPGADGAPGKDADPEIVAQTLIEKHFETLRGEKGADGKDADPEIIADVLVKKYLEQIKGVDGIGIKAVSQSDDKRSFDLEFDNGETVAIELPVIEGEKGERGEKGFGFDVKAWEPESIHIEGEIVQHHIGRLYVAKCRTNQEPGDGSDWERVGNTGLKFCGGHKKDHEYEPGDIYVKDYSAFLWDGKKANLIAARQKETPAVDVAKALIEMPKLLDSVIKGLIDPMAEVAEQQITQIVAKAFDEQQPPLMKDDHGQWYFLHDGEAHELFDKSLTRFVEAAKAEDKKPPLNQFVGDWKFGDDYIRGDVVRYGNQLYACWKSGKAENIDIQFIMLLNSTVIGGGSGGSGGATFPPSSLPALAVLATSPTLGVHWVDGAGIMNVVTDVAAMNALGQDARVSGSFVVVQNTGTPTSGRPSLYRWDNGRFTEVLPPLPTDNVLRSLDYNPVTRNAVWNDARTRPGAVDNEADLNSRTILPTSQLVAGKLVYVRSNGTLYEFVATPASVTNTIADWSPIVNRVNHYARIGNLPDPATASPPLQDGQFAYVDFDIAAAPYGRLFVYDLANNRWNPVNTKNWIKDNRNNPDQATDQARGDFMTTTENLHKELKVHDGTAWQKIYSEDDVKAWIAAGSQFRGTAENDGYGTIGSIGFSNLPAQNTLNVNNKGWYWTFVGQTGHVIAANEIGGVASGIDGARLSVGDWIQVAETAPPVYNTPGDPTTGVATPGVYQYVHIPGDLLSKSRGDGLYGLNNWVAGAYEMGSLVIHNGDVWKASSAVILADGEPAAVTAPARPQISRITIPGNLLAGERVEITIGADTYDATVQAGENVAAFVTRMIAEIPLSAQLRAHVTAAAVAGQVNALDLTGLNNAPLPAVTVTTNATHVIIQTSSNGRNNWAKVNISGGVKNVSSDADLPATGVANGSVYLVLSSARAGGKQALYSWDQGAGVWQELGGGGNPLVLSGGKIIYPNVFVWDGAATKPTPSVKGDVMVNSAKKQMDAFSIDGANWTDFIPAGGVQLWTGTGNKPTPNSPGSILVNTTTKNPVSYVVNNAWVDFISPPRLQNPQWQRMANEQEFAASKNAINASFSRKQFSNMVGSGVYELKAVFEADCPTDNISASFYLKWFGGNTNLATTSYTTAWGSNRRRVELSGVFSLTAGQTSIDFEISVFSPSYNNDRRWYLNKGNTGYYLLTHLA